MNGLLVIDKPVGPTSHDVVARVRRALGERRVGHTGTLDPAASGMLLLVLGRATRLARFLSGQDKTYRATIRLGIDTDSHDSTGIAVGPRYEGRWPDRETIERALDAFRGTYAQQPPAYSAKKIGGQRSYRLARRATPRTPPGLPDPPGLPALPDPPGLPGPAALPAPVTVTVRELRLLDARDDVVTLHIECSAGFYVRALAHALGRRLGTGAHLSALERIASGRLALADAISLDRVEADPAAAASAVVPPARMLPELPACRLTHDGARRVVHGQDVRPVDINGPPAAAGVRLVRLLGPDGDLVAVGEPSEATGLLHPLVVLV
jgi:tRNA pseudouridine55 synthase